MNELDLNPYAPYYQPAERPLPPERPFGDSRYFKLWEFACPLTKRVIVWPLLLRKLDELRRLMDRPLIISSGYRSPEYNKRVGGALHSQHLEGRAADIPILDNADGRRLLLFAEEIGFNGIGVYPTAMFIHLDIRLSGHARWGEYKGKPISYEAARNHLLGDPTPNLNPGP